MHAEQPAKPKLPKGRLIWIPFGLSLATLGAILGISSYAATHTTKATRVPIDGNPADLGLAYEDISFSSKDGLTLRGWWLKAVNSKRAIIMVHGANRHRADPEVGMLDIARALVSHGYNILTFDLRGHGQSDGKHVSAGYHERKDLYGAIEYAKRQGATRIGAIGFSLGAATAIMAAADCEEIDAVVADSSFADLADIIRSEFSKRSNIPLLFMPWILYISKKLYSIDLSILKPVDAVKQTTSTPLLVIHGGQDTTIPVKHAHMLAKASNNVGGRLWVVPEAKHVGSYIARPREYLSEVISFFDKVLSYK